MTQSIGELIARFELARQKLETALEQSDSDVGNLVVEADREVSEVFSQILNADLSSTVDYAYRMEFLLNEIITASDRDDFVCTLAERAMADMRQAAPSAGQSGSAALATG